MPIWFWLFVDAMCFAAGTFYGTWYEHRRLMKLFNLIQPLGAELAKGGHEVEPCLRHADEV
jgi:hypothetical protein